MKKLDQKGMLDLTVVVVAVLLLGVAGFAYWRVQSKNSSTSASIEDGSSLEPAETLPENLSNLKTLDEIGQIAGISGDVSIIKFELESKDGGYVYKVILSNGRKLEINAASGAVLSEETTDVSEDDKIPAGINVTVTPSDAYKIAASRSSSPIKKIEMEVEDKKVVYKIEYRDGSKIEIDASTGTTVKSEIKGEDKQENEDRDEEDDKDSEDHANEDSDDSVDSEDHEEEDR